MAGRRAFARTATDISLLTPASGQTAGYHSPAPHHRLHAHPPSSSQESDSSLVATDDGLDNDPFTAETDAALVVRYLTPHKIAILILVEYYCREMHASSDVEATLDLLLFLVKQIKDPNEYIQPGLKGLLKAVADIKRSGEPVEQHLVRTLKRIKSPSHLEDFILGLLPIDEGENERRYVGLKDLVVRHMPMNEEDKAELAPTSVLGLYVRKAQMAFRRMSFEELCRLYTTFELYIAGLDSNMQQGPQDTVGYSGARSIFDAEKYLDAKVTELSKTRNVDIPQDLLEHVYGIHRRMPLMAKSDYIMCLYAQETADFETAVGSLHRFFDYCMSHDRTLYQYALLNLAMLHARFGHYGPALLAIRETIEIARDNLDDECLSYARSWLNRLTMAAPDARDSSAESHTLAALAAKTDRPSFHYLHSLSELTASKHLLGTSVAQSMEALVKGASIGLKHSLDDVGGVAQLYQSKAWGMYGNPALSSLYSQLQQTYRPTETDMGDVAAGYTKHATDLAQYGHFKEAVRVLEQAKQKFPLSTIRSIPWIQTLAQTLQRQAMASKRLKDAEIWINNMATTLRNKDILSSSSSSLGSQSGTRGTTTMEQHQQHQPLRAVAKARAGTARGADPKGASTKSSRGAQDGGRYTPGGGGRGGFSTNGGSSTTASKPMAIDQDETSLEMQLDILLQRVLFSAATDQRTEAVEMLARGIDAVQAHQPLWPAGMQRYTVIYLLALAEIYMDAGSVVSAIPLILTTMTLSEQHFQKSLFFLVTLRLAEALLHLEAAQQATQLVDGIMTQVLSQADLFTQATAFFQYAKCLLAQLPSTAGIDGGEEEKAEKDEDEEQKRRHLAQVLHLLQRSIEGFQRLDSVDDVQRVLYFMIRVHYELGEDKQVAAKMRLFRELGQQARQDQHHRPPSWYAFYFVRHDLSEVLATQCGVSSS